MLRSVAYCIFINLFFYCNGSHSSGIWMGWDFPPVFSWNWDGTGCFIYFFVGVGRERFENPLPCHSLVCVSRAQMACCRWMNVRSV